MRLVLIQLKAFMFSVAAAFIPGDSADTTCLLTWAQAQSQVFMLHLPTATLSGRFLHSLHFTEKESESLEKLRDNERIKICSVVMTVQAVSPE